MMSERKIIENTKKEKVVRINEARVHFYNIVSIYLSLSVSFSSSVYFWVCFRFISIDECD